MGFNKKYLPEIEDLKEIRRSFNNDEEFISMYLYKPDAIIGSNESHSYLKTIEIELNEKS